MGSLKLSDSDDNKLGAGLRQQKVIDPIRAGVASAELQPTAPTAKKEKDLRFSRKEAPLAPPKDGNASPILGGRKIKAKSKYDKIDADAIGNDEEEELLEIAVKSNADKENKIKVGKGRGDAAPGAQERSSSPSKSIVKVGTDNMVVDAKKYLEDILRHANALPLHKLIAKAANVPVSPSNKSDAEENIRSVMRKALTPASVVEVHNEFRVTSLHIAMLCYNKTNEYNIVIILLELLLSYRKYTFSEIENDLSALFEEKITSIEEIKKKFLVATTAADKGRAGSPAKKVDKAESKKDKTATPTGPSLEERAQLKEAVNKKIEAINDWFDKEKLRKIRRLEFRLEMWYQAAVRTRDAKGRTIYHLVASLNLPIKFAHICQSIGGGIFFSADNVVSSSHSNIKLKNIFSAQEMGLYLQNHANQDLLLRGSMYEVATGREVASKSRSSSLPALPAYSHDDDDDFGDGNFKIGGDSLTFGVEVGLRSVLYDVSSMADDNGIFSSNADSLAVNYEVVVPWLLRNLQKRAREQGAKKKKTALEVITGHINSINCDVNDNYNSMYDDDEDNIQNILIIPELKILLTKFNIRVTYDVIREVCRQFNGSQATILKKWKRIKVHQKALRKELKEKKEMLQRQKDALAGARKAGARQPPPRKVVNRADAKQGGDDDRSGAKLSSSGSKDDGPSSPPVKPMNMAAIQKQILQLEASIFDMDDSDDIFGLDVRMLMDSMGSGKAFQCIDPRHSRDHVDFFADKKAAAEGSPDASKEESKSDRDGSEKKTGESALLRLQRLQSSQAASKRSMGMFRSFDSSARVSACSSAGSIDGERRDIINLSDNLGQTALYEASFFGHKDVILFLLDAGADIAVQTASHQSAVTVARGQGIKALLEKQLVGWLGQKDLAIDPAAVRSSLGGSTGEGSRYKLREQMVMELGVQLQQLQDHNWSYSRSPLAWAVYNGLVNAVKQQLKAPGLNIDACDISGRTVVHECCGLAGVMGTNELFFKHSIEILEDLLNAGASVDSVTVSGRTPLHEIFCRSQDDASPSFARLQSSKEGFYAPNTVKDKLVLANYRRQLVRALLQWGADPLARDRSGLSALHYCCRENMSGCLVEMLRAGADGAALGDQGQTSLHLAAKAGATRTAHVLCRWDADYKFGRYILYRKDKQGKLASQVLATPASPMCFETLWSAARSGNVGKVAEMISRLRRSSDALVQGDTNIGEEQMQGSGSGVEAKDDVEEKKDDDVRTSHDEKVRYQEYWLLNGIDSKTRRMQWSALHACIVGWAEFEAVVSLTGSKLLSFNSKMMSSGGVARKGSAPLPSVSLKAREALGITEAQIVAARKNGGSNMSASCKDSYHKDAIAMLIKNGAFVDGTDVNYRTPLMYAAAADLSDACQVLLEAGADTRATDLDGNTALHIAYMYSATSVISLLSSAAHAGGDAGSDEEEKAGATDRLNQARRAPLEESGRSGKYPHVFFSYK